MKQVIVRETDSTVEGGKRQHFPVVFEWYCEDCQKTQELDMTDGYMMYPIFGKVEELTLYCHECECERLVLRVIPRVTLDIVDARKYER